MTTIDSHYHRTAGAGIVIDVIRMMLGGLLLFMGIRFGGHPHDILGMMGNSSGFLSLFVVHYIVMCHIVGGALLILGLLTRISAIVQLPILAGAMVLTAHGGLGSIYTGFWFALAVFVLLLVVSYYGGGWLSIDNTMRSRRERIS